jgi:hypothetical protein
MPCIPLTHPPPQRAWDRFGVGLIAHLPTEISPSVLLSKCHHVIVCPRRFPFLYFHSYNEQHRDVALTCVRQV